MGEAGEKIGLEAFLNGLPADTAAELRTIAARIDDLARTGDALEGIENRFRPWVIGTGAAFVLGLVFFFMPDQVNRWIALALLGALPCLCAVYAWKTRARTWADSDIDRLNRDHFLPHQGIYFPASQTPAGVVRINYTPPPPEPAPGTYPKDPRKPENYPGTRW